MSSIEVPLKKTCLALCALSGCVLFADVPAPRGPVYYLPLDGDARWGGAALAKPAVVHGASKYVDGVVGRGLDVKRHAYDQVTALVADALPEFPLAEGTFAFWFKPHWKETDGRPHRIFSIGTKDWTIPFRFYAVKGRGQSLDISFCAPKQMQILKRNIFLPETWVHLAFAWSAAAKQYVFFVNGKECDRRMNPSAFSLTAASVPVKFALGEGTDRFKAVVGDGVYDEIRVYDRALSAAELAMLVTGGETVKMSPVALPRGSAFGFAFAEDRLSATQPLMRLKGRDGAKLLVAATGASGRLSFLAECGGESAIVESADTLRLKTGYVLAFEERDGALAVLLDGAEQGRFPFRRRFGPIVSAEAADGVTVSEPQERTVRVFPAERSARDVETFSLKGAATRQEGVRSAVSLNAFWRVQPANDYLGAPASGGWEYVRVPGSFRSPHWAFRDRAEPPSWHNRAAWYARTLDVPPEKGPGRTWLVFDNFNADAGRIWFNGRQVHAFRQDFKFFTVVPNRVRVDVTDCLSADGTNEIVLYADRHFVGLWRGVPAIGDHGEIALGDVWLERTPQPATVRTATAFPDWRGKSVLLRARLDNPGAAIAGAKVVFAFRRPEGAKTFAREVQVGAGAKGQLVEWRESWPEPVEWTAERPELYEMSVSLESAAGTLDTLPAQGFGFREMRVENGRLTLNGKPLRLRMWTSPGLDRLLYYYGTPETVDQFVAHVKWLNYDTVRCNPWGKRSAVSRREYLDAFVRDASSPYLAGLDDEDLHDWRGASDTVPAFVTSAEHTPHYPRSKWKCGNGGIVSGCVIRKPSRGNFRTVVESGFDLQYASLLEERRGSARTVWCQLDVTSRFGVDPAATRLVDNLIYALTKARVPFVPARVACVGDAKPLTAFGVKPGPRGNGAVVLMMPDACRGARRLQFRAEPPVPTVSPSDTYYRTAQELPEPLFSVEAKGGETVVRLAVAPGDVKGPWAEEKVARVWSGVFEALGIEQDVESAYYGKVNGYDGDAFHNW